MWILTEAPKGSNYYEAESQTGNRALISDTCDMVIFARSQGQEGHRIVAQRGRETFYLGAAPVRGVDGNLNAHMMELARKLGAVVLA